MCKTIVQLLTGLILCAVTSFLPAQTGPNSPVSAANNTSIGANAWSNTGNVFSSNNSYATVATKGLSNYIFSTNYGFAISVPSSITGIELEIERSTTSSTAVATLNNWTTGMTKTVSAGVSRCLIACIVQENGQGPRDITAMTYGGQSMTQITETFVGSATGFMGKIEYWQLMETGIAAASNTSFVITYNGTTLQEYWEATSSAVYQFVDQTAPVFDFENFTSNNSTNPITLSPALTTRAGGMSISTVFCGNNTTPASSVGGTNTYGINSTFTEVIDTYSANAGFTGSGGSFQIAHKAAAAAGTEGPTYTFAGTVNRQVVSAIHLQSLREADNSVRLIKAGAVAGSDYAQTTSSWPSVDTYTTYGGAADLWGTTWTDAEVNASNFGAAISALVQNGTARVDHMRITIYSFSTLPVELIEFSGENKNRVNYLRWQTASERNNKQFVIERSADMIDFKQIGSLQGKGNSVVINSYEFGDEEASGGFNYYRLKQIDEDGTFRYSKPIVIDNSTGSDGLVVYPNPSTGLFSLASDYTIQEGISIYTQDMKLVKKVNPLSPSEPNFSLEELADGVYYMIYTSGGNQKIKRLEKTCRGH